MSWELKRNHLYFNRLSDLIHITFGANYCWSGLKEYHAGLHVEAKFHIDTCGIGVGAQCGDTSCMQHLGKCKRVCNSIDRGGFRGGPLFFAEIGAWLCVGASGKQNAPNRGNWLWKITQSQSATVFCICTISFFCQHFKVLYFQIWLDRYWPELVTSTGWQSHLCHMTRLGSKVT